MDPLALRVAARFKDAFKYDDKEKKTSKVERLTKVLREKTGLSRSMGETIVDALVRGREVERLAMQKSWPIEDGTITGPDGTMTLAALREQMLARPAQLLDGLQRLHPLRRELVEATRRPPASGPRGSRPSSWPPSSGAPRRSCFVSARR